MFGALTVYYLRDHNPIWREVAEGMIRDCRIAYRQRDYGYFTIMTFM